MKIIIGLGNPGKEYEITRHNTGWLFIDYLRKKYNVEKKKEKFESEIFEIKIKGEKVMLVKPLTYMNLSGRSVEKIKKFYKVLDEDVLIVYDDIDIAFGEVRYRTTGSGGTHNGMKNIIQVLKNSEISRIRIGIGKPTFENQDLAEFVLDRFTKLEIEHINEVFKLAEEKMNIFLDKHN